MLPVLKQSSEYFTQNKNANGCVFHNFTILQVNGNIECRQYGQLHRTDGPARICYNGDLEWYVCGVLHRLDGPAVIRGKHREWWRCGKLHREDGPAVQYANGDLEWRQHGLLHCEDTAIIRSNGDLEWWKYGIFLRQELAPEIAKNVPWSSSDLVGYTLAHVHANGDRLWECGYKTVTERRAGIREWREHGKVHRSDGPAVESRQLSEWWVNGVPHRVGGPAVEVYVRCEVTRADGSVDVLDEGHTEWWYEGYLHCEHEPAIFRPHGHCEWWMHGIMLE